MHSSRLCIWCCDTLLRHVNHSGSYWFCLSCRTKIPDQLAGRQVKLTYQPLQSISLPPELNLVNLPVSSPHQPAAS